MTTQKEEEKSLLPHHEQLALCTTRLPYRQGRKLTAVKVYTVNNESAHLLVFGVPSLNLRRETKDLFIKFGRLLQFNLMKDYAVEDFTETYHAYYDKIQSARVAKKMLDTKNFYGGSLHVCYAPELETLEETRNKLMQRKRDVMFRLRNLQKESSEAINESNLNIHSDIQIGYDLDANNQSELKLDNTVSVQESNEIINEIKPNYDVNFENDTKKLNMGESNVIIFNSNKNKRKNKETVSKKRFRTDESKQSNEESLIKSSTDIIDCTSVEKEVVSNINEALNYSNFGNEVIKKVNVKPLNKIVFNLNKKS